MGHITKLAAQRVRTFMTSGPHALRTFQAEEGAEREHVADRRGSHHTPSYNRYHLPRASDDEFMRLAKLPGIDQYLRGERNKDDSRVPWAYQGHDRYMKLHRKHTPFRHEELHGERQFRAWGINHNVARNATGLAHDRGNRNYHRTVDALHTVKDKINWQFPDELGEDPDAKKPHPPIPAVPEHHFNP